jgi:hypothetical protein
VSFIPRSCRTNFKIGASNIVKGSNIFTTLQTTIEDNNKRIAEQQRDYVKQCVKIELDEHTKALKDKFCEGLFKLSTIFLHNGHFGSDVNNESIHWLSLDIIARRPLIIKYIFNGNLTDFQRYYKKKYNITTPAPPIIRPKPDYYCQTTKWLY